ncbi:MAG: acyl-CoA synthetase (AMP-forming)/AMP-acid ligase II [Candidatus Poriferisodalaceae bacterium]
MRKARSLSGGFNIYPTELENVLSDHPAVIEAAIFGVPDDRWGETPCAVVTCDPLVAVTEDELVTLCADRLGSYKKPGTVVITSEPLPKSAVGEIFRKSLREPYSAGAGVERVVWLKESSSAHVQRRCSDFVSGVVEFVRFCDELVGLFLRVAHGVVRA